MFGIGMPEMLIILAVALIIFGPKRLPELAKSLGRALGEFKRATSDLKQSIETETGLDDVRSSLDDVKKDIKDQTDLSYSKSESPSSGENDADEPLSKVKAAFEEMNADSRPDAKTSEASESESDSETASAVDPDTTPQEKSTP